MSVCRRKNTVDDLLAALEAMSKVRGIDLSMEMLSLNKKLQGLFFTRELLGLRGMDLVDAMNDAQLAIAIAQNDESLELYRDGGRPNNVVWGLIRAKRPKVVALANKLMIRGVKRVHFDI